MAAHADAHAPADACGVLQDCTSVCCTSTGGDLLCEQPAQSVTQQALDDIHGTVYNMMLTDHDKSVTHRTHGLSHLLCVLDYLRTMHRYIMHRKHCAETVQNCMHPIKWCQNLAVGCLALHESNMSVKPPGTLLKHHSPHPSVPPWPRRRILLCLAVDQNQISTLHDVQAGWHFVFVGKTNVFIYVSFVWPHTV